ncbi:MAG: DUF1599 domain-containing protein [Bacteroidota bacterium]
MEGKSNNTEIEYRKVIQQCRALFEKKTKDYGTAWRILRPSSLTDQIFIKASRIRSIQEKGVQKIEEDSSSEFIGIINYCIISLIQLQLTEKHPLELPANEVMKLYDTESEKTLTLMLDKNHDYGEAWRLMRVSSITDIILMKIMRTRQIEDNAGATLVSEGVEANYRDMMNYAIFALILKQEQK